MVPLPDGCAPSISTIVRTVTADSRVQEEVAERLLVVQAPDGLCQQRGETHPVHGERQMGRRRHAVGRQESSDRQGPQAIDYRPDEQSVAGRHRDVRSAAGRQ